MPGELEETLPNIALADLQTTLGDYEFEGYAVVSVNPQPDGRWTIVARQNAANGAPQTPNSNDAIDPQPAPPAPPPQGGALMTLGPRGARLIKAFESCMRATGGGRFHAYLDSVSVPTIGWGHTNHLGRQFDMSAVWSQADCDTEFLNDMKVFEGRVRQLVKVPIDQFQFDALVSFAYNCGDGNLAKSTLLKKVNAKDFNGAALEFGKWVNAGGKKLNGLVRRRKYEARLFQGADDLTYPA